MFDILAELLSSIATFLFPVFASYKALKGNDPAQLSPWLMYWVVLACVLLVEKWFEWLLVWFPFYAWIRAVILLYLVLPQTQGARLIYQKHIHPFLSEYETEIDTFISSAHDRAKAAGLQYIKRAIEFIKVNVLGLAPNRPSSPQSSSSSGGATYAQNLLARFYIPAARKDPVTSASSSYSPPSPPANDLYNLISGVLGQSRGSPASEASPLPDIESKEDRISYIETQRDRLRTVLQVLDKEASTLLNPAGTPAASASGNAEHASSGSENVSSMRKNKSEVDFENVEREDVGEEKRTTSGGWMPWNWRSGASTGSEKTNKPVEPEMASSTGIDTKIDGN